jgi:predicted ArsR family transcriptional regulator
MPGDDLMSNWTLLSNHGHVLVCLSRDSEARLRDVAADVGITERAVQKIVRDLQEGGMISVTKSGRRNCYRIHQKQNLRHELEADCTLRDLIRVINRQAGAAAPETDGDARTSPGVETRQETKPSPPPENAKAGKPAAAKSTGVKESKSSEGPEKQQGTLF